MAIDSVDTPTILFSVLIFNQPSQIRHFLKLIEQSDIHDKCCDLNNKERANVERKQRNVTMNPTKKSKLIAEL